MGLEELGHGGYAVRERERRSPMEAMLREKERERERWSAMMVVADENLGKGMVPWQRG